MIPDAALQTFIAEARELLADIEASLLACERGAADGETINALFRAAHTIKGSAGLFGLDPVVSFTHVMEGVLDRVRGGKQALDPELAGLLLECADHVGGLIASIEQGGDAAEADLARRGAALRERLAGRSDGAPAGEAPCAPASAAPVSREPGATTGDAHWHISLRFRPEVLRHGMDPLSFIRYLTTFGEIAGLRVVDDALPPPERMDPELCYLGFEIGFRTSADKARIESAFDFVREDCTLRILPPRSRIGEYVRLIRELPEADARLGEMLVACGTLTRRELEEALREQSALENGPGPARPLGEILVADGVVRPAAIEAALEKQRQVREARAGEGRSVRIDADKLDRLIDLIGELIIAGASTNLIASRAGLPELTESASRLARLVEEVRDSALNLRMVQIGATFSRFQRVVRDVARELGKDIRLEISGADTELDKTLVERINDPLTHLVRNAMDHGIEPAEARAARGKPAQGVVRLNAYHDSGSIVLEVSDDGGGLNREKILRKARERGIVKDGQSLTDAEIEQLVFEPGLSTADAVTSLSGRGVGMDVVRRNIAALRGSIEIASEEGRGTTVRIRLPLTLAIIDGFLVGVGHSAFVVPLDMVEECIEIGPEQAGAAAGRGCLDLRGRVLPLLRLRELFEIAERPGRRESVVVVRCAGQRIGLVVDELLGELQTVIKPLSRLFSGVKGIGGSTILGSGAVALILDVPGLVQQCAAGGAAGGGRATCFDHSQESK